MTPSVFRVGARRRHQAGRVLRRAGVALIALGAFLFAEDPVPPLETTMSSGISSEGPKAGRNPEVLASLVPLAEKYRLSGARDEGREVVGLIDGLLKAAARWPVTDRLRGVLPPNAPDLHGEYGAYWTTWYYYDPEEVAKVARAYALVRDTEVFREMNDAEGGALRLRIEDQFSHWWKTYSVTWPWSYYNPDGYRLTGMAKIAAALGRPDWVHQVLRWTDRYLTSTMRRDGLWYEVSPSYHKMAYRKIPDLADALRGYSDPSGYRDSVDGTHIKDFDPGARWGRWLRMQDTALSSLLLPDGWPLVLNDSHYRRRVEIDGPYQSPPKSSVHRLLPASGIAMLGGGPVSGQFQLWLNFETPSGHDHRDGLGIVMHAYGQEILSEGDYLWTPLGETEDPLMRQWTMQTVVHNTVVVDEVSQIGRGDGVTLKTSWGDPAVPDWQWPARESHPGNHPNLVLYDAVSSETAVVSAEAGALYPQMSRYQRTLAVIPRAGRAPIVFDLFDCAGGRVHDWMVHGPLHADSTMTSSLNLTAVEGTIGEKIQNLRSSEEADSFFILRIEDAKGVGDLIAFPFQGRPVTLTIGEGPAIRRVGTAEFARIRQTGTVSRFVAVHFPFCEGAVPRVDVRVVAMSSDGSVPVAWEVRHETFRDVFFCPPRRGHGRSAAVRFDRISVRGEFAWIRLDADSRILDGVLLGEGELTVGSETYETDGNLSGEVVGVSVEQSGDGAEGYVEVTGRLAEGSALAGRPLFILAGDGTRHAGRIARVEYRDEGGESGVSRVYLTDNPGFRLIEDGLEWTFFPNRTIPGAVRYQLLGRWSYAP